MRRRVDVTAGPVEASLRTALVAPDGKLIKLYRGNDWKPEEVAADIRAALVGSNSIQGE